MWPFTPKTKKKTKQSNITKKEKGKRKGGVRAQQTKGPHL
jgi:hypothetical protein